MLDAILSLKIEESDQESISSHNSLSIVEDQESIKSAQVTDEMEAIFISSLYSSLGAPLEGNSRLVFDEFVKKISGLIKIDDTPTKRATFS